jgi:hypothetical protein
MMSDWNPQNVKKAKVTRISTFAIALLKVDPQTRANNSH